MTSPLFDKITIQLNPNYYPGKKVTIQTKNNGPNNVYIQSTQMNGKSFNMPWIMHDDLIKGGLLEINMGATPNTKWGIETLNAPVSTLQKK
jgi:putative alpha-1,2-mannosidase